MSKWEMVKLEDVCDILDSMRVPITASDRKAGIYPYYGANGIQDYVDDYIFDDELVLLAEDGGNFGSKEKPIAYRVSGKCWVNNHAHVLKPKDILNINYLCYSVMFYDVSKLINGTTRAKLNQTAVRRMNIYLPPLDVQKHIGDTLDKTQEIINLYKKQLEELDNLIKSTFYDMFGDPILNTKNWDKKIFTDILILQRGFDLPIQSRKPNGSIEVYGSNGIVDKHSEYKIERGGVITGRSGTIGKVYYTFENYWPLNTTLFTKKCYDNNIIYLAYFLKYFDLKRFCTGTGVPTLNRNIVHSENIIDVPLDLQNKFAQIVTSIEEQKAIVKQSLEQSQNLFNSLMSKYFD